VSAVRPAMSTFSIIITAGGYTSGIPDPYKRTHEKLFEIHLSTLIQSFETHSRKW